MFISTVILDFKVDDIVYLRQDLNVVGGIFTRGHIFRIKNIYNKKNYSGKFIDIIDQDGNFLKNISSTIISKDISYIESNKIQSKRIYISSVLKCIEHSCLQKIIEYEDRKEYNICSVNENIIGCNCKPRLECIIYSEKAKKEYPELLRYLKIKKLKNETKN